MKRHSSLYHIHVLKGSHSRTATLIFLLLTAFRMVDFRRKCHGTTNSHGGKITGTIPGKFSQGQMIEGVEAGHHGGTLQPSVPKFLALL